MHGDMVGQELASANQATGIDDETAPFVTILPC